MPLSAEQATADEADLQTGITELSSLVSSTLGLNVLLERVAAAAARAIPGADGAGVTLLRIDSGQNRVEALAASHPFVSEIDEIDVTVNEGPCITAALERRTVRSGSLGGEKMWPRFGPRVGRLGVHSALSLPLLLPGQLVGAINVYAHDKALRHSVGGQSMVNQAIGVLIGRGRTPEQAAHDLARQDAARDDGDLPAAAAAVLDQRADPICSETPTWRCRSGSGDGPHRRQRVLCSV